MAAEQDPGPPPPPPSPPPPSSSSPPDADGGPASAASVDDEPRERFDRGLSDFVRRAVSAGLEAASRGKSDIVRVATTEVRSWLDKLDLDTEIVKAMSRMVLEVKAEIRFRPTEGGKLTPDATGDVKIKSAPKG
jgi:hypothetical protein